MSKDKVKAPKESKAPKAPKNVKIKFEFTKDFIEKGSNKLILQIVFAVIIVVLSVISLYYVVLALGAGGEESALMTDGNRWYEKDYHDYVLYLLKMLLIFALPDFIIIVLVKPLYGFTNFFENYKAKKKSRDFERAVARDEKRESKIRMDAVRKENKAKKAAAKAAKKA